MTRSAYERTQAACIAQTIRRRGELQQVSPSEVHLLTHFDRVGLEPIQQHPVGPYDLDFYFPAVHLCVEIDGQTHDFQRAYDSFRDKFLQKRGIDTLRLPARVVHTCPDLCAALVKVIVGSLHRGRPFPTGMTVPIVKLVMDAHEARTP